MAMSLQEMELSAQIKYYSAKCEKGQGQYSLWHWAGCMDVYKVSLAYRPGCSRNRDKEKD